MSRPARPTCGLRWHPDRPSYGLTKNSGTLLLQQIAKDVRLDDMQIVSYHPGGILTDSVREAGYSSSINLYHGKLWLFLKHGLTGLF